MSVLIRRPYLRLAMAIVWMMLQESYTLASFVVGLLMATLVFAFLAAPQVRLDPIRWESVAGFFRWVRSLMQLTVYFIWEVVKSNHAVGVLVLKPNLRLQPGIIAMPLRVKTSGQVALLSSLITLTPGTLVLEVGPALDVMYIHCIDAANEAEALAAPRRFEELVMEVLR